MFFSKGDQGWQFGSNYERGTLLTSGMSGDATYDAAYATTGLVGTVRSYNGSKGFGFITGQGQFSDVMFSRHELPDDAREVRGNFLEGRSVIFNAIIKPDGRAKATSVSMQAEEGKSLPGQIKVYSDNHRNGLLTSHALPDVDIRFRIEDFNKTSLNPALKLANDLVIFQYKYLPDGKCVVTTIQFQTSQIASKYGQVVAAHTGGGAVAGVKRPVTMVHQPVVVHPSSLKVQRSSEVPVQATGQYMAGTIKSYNPTKGWGLISTPGIPAGTAGQAGDVFFMKSNLPQQEVRDTELTGRSVNFELVKTPDGKCRAHNVVLVS